jgi:hypothetical protein
MCHASFIWEPDVLQIVKIAAYAILDFENCPLAFTIWSISPKMLDFLDYWYYSAQVESDI